MVDDAAGLGVEGQRVRGNPRVVEPRLMARLAQEKQEEGQEFGRGPFAALERAERSEQRVEEPLVRHGGRQEAMHELGHGEPREIGLEVVVRPAEHLEQRPLRERLQLAIRLDDGDHLAARKEVDASREAAALAPRALREATQDAARTAEQAHRLRGLGPIPVTDADGLVDEVRHGAIVTRRGSRVWAHATSKSGFGRRHAASGMPSV